MKSIVLIVSAALFVPAAQGIAANITPFLTCVDVDEAQQTITAYFGYESFEADIVRFPVGADNRFVPSPPGRGQPILFFPGYHEKAFRVTVPTTGILWLVNGFGVAAQISNQRCTAPASVVQLPPGALMSAYFQKLAAVGSRGNTAWSIDNVPPGLLLSVDGVLSGTPTQAGSFTFKVTAADSISTTSTTYGLNIAGGLSISDSLSTRPPGFVPQFRTVTQVGGSNTATANCDPTEFIVTGGGACVVPNQNTTQGRVASSQLSGNGWAVTCSGGTATATAVCSLK